MIHARERNRHGGDDPWLNRDFTLRDLLEKLLVTVLCARVSAKLRRQRCAELNCVMTLRTELVGD